MTIRRGEPWGRPVHRPAGLRSLASDRALALDLAEGTPSARTVTAGDLHRALGSPPERDDMQELPIDLLDVTIDGTPHVAVAHVVVRRSWWRGPIRAALNVSNIGDWNVAPRAHPNDGRIQVVEVDGSMSLRQRWQARARLEQGTHLPHPAISVRALREITWELDRTSRVWIDGHEVGAGTVVGVLVRPDGATVVV